MASLVGLRLIALAGLAFSSILLADDASRVPFFCPFRGGCAAVTTSEFGRPLGVPLSAVGVAAFAAFYVVTLFPRNRGGRCLGPMAVVAGVIGVLLVGVQFLVLKRACRFCLAVDGAGMLLAAVEIGLPPGQATLSPKRLRRAAWAMLALGVAAAPPLSAVLRPPPSVPPEVQHAWEMGKLNVVEITDFTCPFCRRTHSALEGLRQIYGEDIHLVRFVAARPTIASEFSATRAYECAVRQNEGEKMAHALFNSEDYTAQNMRELAWKVGLDLAQFDADWNDPAIDRQIESRDQWLNSQPFAGLPQVWVQDILLLGEQTPESLLAAARRVGPVH